MWEYGHRRICTGSSTHARLLLTSLGRNGITDSSDHWGTGTVALCARRGPKMVMEPQPSTSRGVTPEVLQRLPSSSQNLGFLLHAQMSTPQLGHQVS